VSEILYCGGAFRDSAECRIEPSDRGFTLGDGVFDTLLALQGQPVQGMKHFERLARHAALLHIPLPETPERLVTIASGLALQNGYSEIPCAIRTTLTRGPSPRGLQLPDNPQPTLIMRGAPVFNPRAEISAIIAQTVRRNEGSPLSQIKSLNYGDQILALQEARQRKATEAILLNNAGNACCATSANIFVLFADGRCVTPPQKDGAVDGVLRAGILAAGLAIEETVAGARLADAEAVFLTSSVAGVRRIGVLEDNALAETDAAKNLLEKMQACHALTP
jgi:branched-chain amino acid aminotransferase